MKNLKIKGEQTDARKGVFVLPWRADIYYLGKTIHAVVANSPTTIITAKI